MRRITEIGALALAFVAICAFALLSSGSPSTHSTYDGGRNGYEALFNVLRAEGVAVSRLRLPLGLLDPSVKVLAIVPDPLSGAYGSDDIKRLQAFVKDGGRIVYFGTPPSDGSGAWPKSLRSRVTRLDADAYTNAALQAHPERAGEAYAALAGAGPVAFDETLYGYDDRRSLWQTLPAPVHAAFWIAVLAVLIGLIGANVRFAPAIAREPPAERDSSAYIDSMAALLQRSRAAKAAIERFARAFPRDPQLAEMAEMRSPDDVTLLRAARLYLERRKEHA